MPGTIYHLFEMIITQSDASTVRWVNSTLLSQFTCWLSCVF